MTHEEREEYIRQAKRSFHTKGSIQNNYSTAPEEKEERKFGFWKIRLLIAVLLFVGFFSLHQNKYANTFFSYDQLTAVIQKNIDVESVAAWFEQ